MATDRNEAGGSPSPGGDIILIVEDDVRASRLASFILEEEGFAVACAISGEEALEMLSTTAMSLILLDIRLPTMDGFTTCQKIRETSQVPIIIVTGEGRDEEKVRGLEMGADDYIPKPFSTNELAARVKAVLRRINDSRSKTVTTRQKPSEPDISAMETNGELVLKGAELNGKHGERNGEDVWENQEITQVSHGHDEAPEDDVGESAPAGDNEPYEGLVKLIVETKGAIKNMVDFVDALREYPQFHLLRMVSNPRRDGMEVWLRLRVSLTLCAPPCWPLQG